MLTVPEQAQPAYICGSAGEPAAFAQVLRLNGTEETARRLQQHLARLGDGAHVCHLYATAGEQIRSLHAFVLEGIRRREQCLYLGDATNAYELLGQLATTGTDVQALIDRGDLLFESAREAYLSNGHFDADAMIEYLAAGSKNAREREWMGLRVMGEMNWALGIETRSKQLAVYEARLNRLASRSGMRIMCLYDRRRFRPEIVRDVLRTHPLAIVGDGLHDNPYFEPAELMLGDSVEIEGRRVDWMLEQLLKRPERADVVPALASWALEHVAHDELMEAAAQIIWKELSARFVEVIELSRSDGVVHRVANVGFGITLPAAVELTLANVWLETGGQAYDQPLLVPDWRDAGPIEQRPELRTHGITSSMGIPISRGQEVAWVQTMATELAKAIAPSPAEDPFESFVNNAPDALARIRRETAVLARLQQDRVREQQRVARAIQAEHLTSRQRDVLRLLARGWTNREIAAELGLAPGTVKNHVADILETLDASDRTQAAVRAVELGMIRPD
jgi:DNA-binding CsgD family transcriptional regulator